MALRFRYPELSLVYNAVPVHQEAAALLVSQPFLKQLTLSDLFRSLCTGGRPHNSWTVAREVVEAVCGPHDRAD